MRFFAILNFRLCILILEIKNKGTLLNLIDHVPFPLTIDKNLKEGLMCIFRKIGGIMLHMFLVHLL